MRNLLLPVAMLALATASPAYAADGPRYDTAQLNVVGVSLGMGADSVREQMREAGFTMVENNFAWTDTYKYKVEEKARQLDQPAPAIPDIKGPWSISGKDSQGNTLAVWFISARNGPKVSSVILTFDKGTNDFNKLPADLIARYGSPSRSSSLPTGLLWCDKTAKTCGGIFGADAPTLTYAESMTNALVLEAAPDIWDKRAEEINALFDKPDSARQRALLGS